MREILFKGKREDNGEWIEGYYIVIAGKHYIYNVEDDIYYQVIPETVSEFTGLTDMNNKKIFEWDYWTDIEEKDIVVVEFINGQYCFVIYSHYHCVLMEYGYDDIYTEDLHEIDCIPMTDYNLEEIEIIGNIHDNADLLKGG